MNAVVGGNSFMLQCPRLGRVGFGNPYGIRPVQRCPVFTGVKGISYGRRTRAPRENPPVFTPSTLTPAALNRKDPAMAKPIAPIKDKSTKSQILDILAERSGVTRKQAGAVIETLSEVIEAHVKKNAVGEFVLPGLLKISNVRKPAVKARKGINPFTKEEVMFKAKPATTVVKIRPLKKLKDMAL